MFFMETLKIEIMFGDLSELHTIGTVLLLSLLIINCRWDELGISCPIARLIPSKQNYN